MSKFNPGSKVYLFNSIAMRIEEDVVYAVLNVPVPVEGRTQDSGKALCDKIRDGEVEVKEQYQLTGHQGIVDSDCVFGSEEGCREFFRNFFALP